MEGDRPRRFRFRLGTLLFFVAIATLIVLVLLQQVEIGRMRRLIDAGQKEKAQLTQILRELRDLVERHR